ncbi:MAG: PAS domain-containing protein, partial [Clostridia bacterium]|nr:PAS domain-containing protein [Clostridia bacterium]
LKNVAIFYGEQIKSIFKDNIVIEPMSMEENNFNEPIEADIVLISTKSLYESVKSSLYYVDEILFARTSVSRKGYDVLETVPRKARALLVNNTAEASLDAITLIRQLGFKEIELFPYFPGAQYEEKFDFAITPNEMVHVPSYIKKVYDIGDRLLDLATLMDISICLGLDDYMKRPDILELTAEIVPLSNSFRKVMTDSMRVEGQLDVLFKYMSEGIITINQSGEILLLNEAAVHYLGVTTEPVLGRHIGELWSALPITEVVNTNMPINNKLVKYKGVPCVVDVYPIHELKRANGAVCIFKSFIESERKQHKLREQITGKGHVATYTFEDIAGQSDKMVNLRKLATHMA